MASELASAAAVVVVKKKIRNEPKTQYRLRVL